MKIELKKIDFNQRMSEETNCFVAHLYINDKFAGIALNHGHGGATSYTANDLYGQDLIKKAEDYCKALPPYKWESRGETHELPMNLEFFIDNFLEQHLVEKEIQKFRNKIAKASLNAIVVGVPDVSFKTYPYNYNIAEILKFPDGKQMLANSMAKRVKLDLEEGKQILNTNIPEEVYRLAKLKEGQYVKPDMQKHDVEDLNTKKQKRSLGKKL